jgi:hypothetical protein
MVNHDSSFVMTFRNAVTEMFKQSICQVYLHPMKHKPDKVLMWPRDGIRSSISGNNRSHKDSEDYKNIIKIFVDTITITCGWFN